jgi:hypothetical protein
MKASVRPRIYVAFFVVLPVKVLPLMSTIFVISEISGSLSGDAFELVVWDMKLCRLVYSYRTFGAVFCLSFEGGA